jgi:Uma2 family endonuclease
MTSLGLHESRNRFIDDLVRTIADEWNLPLKKMGSLTLKKAGIQNWLEPDSCYYVQNEPLVRGKADIRLDQDPPPDLVLEVDLSSHSLDKLSIYAALGVVEVWRYDGAQLLGYCLNSQDQSYTLISVSHVFSPLVLADLLPFIAQSLTAGETATLKTFRSWLRNFNP